MKILYQKPLIIALAGVTQWFECQPVNQRSPVRIPVRAHDWVVSPGAGAA